MHYDLGISVIWDQVVQSSSHLTWTRASVDKVEDVKNKETTFPLGVEEISDADETRFTMC